MRIEKKASIVATLVATLLMVVKLIAGIASGSAAILASAIDSLMDMAISLFNYFALRQSDKEADAKFNYGRGKIEAIAAVIEGTIITLSGLYILYLSSTKLYNQEHPTMLDTSMAVMLFSTIVTGALVLYLRYVARRSRSIVTQADVLHYQVDLYSNGGILIALGIIALTDWYIIDALVGLAIAFYIIYSAYGLIKEGILILLDAALEPEIVEQIIHIFKTQEGLTDYHWLKTRRAGRDIFVSVHLVFNEEITLLRAHHISDKVEQRIRALDKDFQWNLSIHLDPHDDSH